MPEYIPVCRPSWTSASLAMSSGKAAGLHNTLSHTALLSFSILLCHCCVIPMLQRWRVSGCWPLLHLDVIVQEKSSQANGISQPLHASSILALSLAISQCIYSAVQLQLDCSKRNSDLDRILIGQCIAMLVRACLLLSSNRHACLNEHFCQLSHIGPLSPSA